MNERRPKVELRFGDIGSAGAPPSVSCEVDRAAATVDLGDTSVLGVFIQCDAPLAVDREVDVAVRFADATFGLRAHVVQSVPRDRAAADSRKSGFALLFEHVDEHERTRLRRRIDAALALRAASNRPQPTATPKQSKPPQPTAAPKQSKAQTDPPAPDDTEELARLSSLKAELCALSGKPPWAVLGVSQSADPQAAKDAFFAASKRYHPHKFSRYRLPDIKRVVTELFIAHKRAHDAMSRKVTGRAPTAPLAPTASTQTPSTPGPAPAAVQPVAMDASVKVSMAAPPRISPVPPRASMDLTGNSALERALRAPGEPKFRARDAANCVHEAIKHLAQSRYDAAEVELEKALALDPLTPNARVWLLVAQARKHKAEGKTDVALEKYKEVLMLDAKHHEALTELRKLSQPGRDKSAGLLSRFFGGSGEEK